MNNINEINLLKTINHINKIPMFNLNILPTSYEIVKLRKLVQNIYIRQNNSNYNIFDGCQYGYMNLNHNSNLFGLLYRKRCKYNTIIMNNFFLIKILCNKKN